MVKKKKIKIKAPKVITTKEILGEVSKMKLKQIAERQEERTREMTRGGLFFKKNE